MGNEVDHRPVAAIYDTIWHVRARFRCKGENSTPLPRTGVGDRNDCRSANTQPVSKVITLAFLLVSASSAVAQLPPPPIRVVPNLNPSSSLVLPPGPARVSPTLPTASGASGCCHGTNRNLHHQLKKNAHHRRRSYSADTQERIAEMQRHAAERADRALKRLFQETEPRAKGKQSRVKP